MIIDGDVLSRTLTAKILRFLAENPGATIKEVSRALGISQDLARSVIYRLRNKGFIEKSGDGYVVIGKGEWFLKDVLKAKAEGDVKERESEAAEQTSIETMQGGLETSREQIISKINELMGKVKSIEEQLAGIKEELKVLEKRVYEGRVAERSVTRRLHKPVVSLQEAVSIYGGLLESMRSEGSVIVVGSLAVDREFYDEFRKKFPIPVDDKSKLSEYEQILLEEMIRDARVIVSGGKLYKLIG